MKFGLILYDSRSGSTLLSSVLHQYECFAVTLESSFPRLLLEYRLLNKNNFEISDILDYLYSEIQFRELNINRSQFERRLIERKSNSINKVFYTIIEFLVDENMMETSTIILKIPHAHHSLGDLRSLLGAEFKILHLIRDPRAVFLSKKNTRSLSKNRMEDNVFAAGLNWKNKIKLFENNSQDNFTLRYEDLLTDYNKTIESILEFFDVPKSKQTPKNDRTKFFNQIGENQRSLHTNLTSSFNKSRIDLWKKDLKDHEIVLLEIICKYYLLKYKYTLEFPKTSKVYKNLIYLKGITFYVISRLRNLGRHILNGQFKTFYYRKIYELSGVNRK